MTLYGIQCNFLLAWSNVLLYYLHETFAKIFPILPEADTILKLRVQGELVLGKTLIVTSKISKKVAGSEPHVSPIGFSAALGSLYHKANSSPN